MGAKASSKSPDSVKVGICPKAPTPHSRKAKSFLSEVEVNVFSRAAQGPGAPGQAAGPAGELVRPGTREPLVLPAWGPVAVCGNGAAGGSSPRPVG